jgi:metal-responsive CopG/Arc/MetJ family transcriptional regulator
MITVEKITYSLPPVLVRRIERVAQEHYKGNRSAAVAACLREALPSLEVLPREATKAA